MHRVIDPHLHLFNLEQGDYFWLEDGQAPSWPDKQQINRNYQEQDLALSDSVELSGFVHIEAGFNNASPWLELKWLENHCQLPFRSIAYIDLLSDGFAADLRQLQKYRSLIGTRYILDEDAETVLTNPDVIGRLDLLAEQGLLFEAQLPLSEQEGAEALVALLQRIPNLKVVINHCGLPVNLNEQWMNAITRLAHFPECYIKCSGWEMFNREWSVEQAKPIISFAIRQFGLTRVMLASNFPVSELGCSYTDLWQRLLEGMKWQGFEREMLTFENAKRIYQLDFD